MVIVSFEYLQSVWGSHIQVSPVVLYPVLCQVHLQQEVNNRYACMNICIHTCTCTCTYTNRFTGDDPVNEETPNST